MPACSQSSETWPKIYYISNKGKHKEPRVWNIKPKNAARYIDFRICQIVVAPLAVYNKLRQPEDVWEGGGGFRGVRGQSSIILANLAIRVKVFETGAPLDQFLNYMQSIPNAN